MKLGAHVLCLHCLDTVSSLHRTSRLWLSHADMRWQTQRMHPF